MCIVVRQADFGAFLVLPLGCGTNCRETPFRELVVALFASAARSTGPLPLSHSMHDIPARSDILRCI
jgi:hypothetical protein